MAFTEEFIKEVGLTEEQVSKVNGFYETNVIPELKKGWDGKANTDAEGILTGASKYAQQKLGIEIEREQGEKYGDYLARIAESGLSKKQEALKLKEAELEEKLKNFKGSDELKSALEEERLKNDNLLKQNAELERLKGFDEKYEQASKELSGLKLEVSFGKVKPNFPETVNKYEADAKWNEFKKNVLENNTIELIDNEPFAIDKENPHKKVKLSDLLQLDKNISELLKGRQQQGTGARQAEFAKVEGIPFDVPKGLTNNEQSLLVAEHLEKKLGSKFHKDYMAQFTDLLKKVKSVQ